ncbi:MAG TPA: hypothetical protein VFX47_05925 [Gammaproteobacteria bacterium]|nr:hypothetical protein [Gammaproteobacteria bacterium]
MIVKKPRAVDCHSLVRRGPLLWAALICLLAPAAHAGLGLHRIIVLPEVRGQFGRLALDTAHQRLFVPVTGSDSLLAVDLEKGVISNRLKGLNAPRDTVFLPDGQVAVSDGGNGAISFHDAATLQPRGTLIFGSDASALQLDPESGNLYLGYGRKQQSGIAVIGSDGKLRAQLPMPDHPQGLVLDTRAQRLYVSFAALNGIAVFDLTDGKLIANWSLGEMAGTNYPLALDADGKRLFVGGRRGDEIAVLDTQSGKLLQNIAAPGDTDALNFDARNHELYASGGIGQLAVYVESADGLLHELDRIATRRGARSGLLDAGSGHYYLAVPASAGKPAEIRIYLVINQPADGEQQ